MRERLCVRSFARPAKRDRRSNQALDLMKIHQYTLKEMEEAIYKQLVNTHSDYKYMTDFVFPLLRQKRLCQFYTGIVGRIYATVQDAIILGLSKLLDTTRRPLVIHFKKFIDTAQKISPRQIRHNSQWVKFLNEANSFLKELPSLKRKLDPHRNKFRAHLIPALPDSQERTTWNYWVSVLERMENIYNLFQGAVKDTNTSPFWAVNLRSEPASFLKWCRLDDFGKHKDFRTRAQTKWSNCWGLSPINRCNWPVSGRCIIAS
jgi:hypothetical protein